MGRVFFCLVFLLSGFMAESQTLQVLTSGNSTSLRGLSVVNDKVIWVSGSNGTVGKSLDGGNTWKWYTVKGYEKRDFRDIEAFDEKTALIMAVDSPGHVLKTFNGGENWKIVYTDTTRGIFFDAMEFWDEQNGILVGDPIEGRIYVARSYDGGGIWHRMNTSKIPELAPGEAMFAASGTNVRRLDIDEACVVTGGMKSRLLVRNKLLDIPIIQGSESTGANSVAIWGRKNRAELIVVVGGDFARDTLQDKNCFLSKDYGKTWFAPSVNPHGYRSCVEFLNKNQLIACGTSGVDVSEDSGMNWKLISREGFHACRKSKEGTAVYLCGSKGRIARLAWKK